MYEYYLIRVATRERRKSARQKIIVLLMSSTCLLDQICKERMVVAAF